MTAELLEPLSPTVEDWFAELDRFKTGKFLANRRRLSGRLRVIE